MISIDKLAYTSKLRDNNPMEKFIFSIFTMILCIALNNVVYSVIITVFMGSITILKGKIPVRHYMELMLIPMFFLVIGVITIAINVVGNSKNVLFSFAILNINTSTIPNNLFNAYIVSTEIIFFITLIYIYRKDFKNYIDDFKKNGESHLRIGFKYWFIGLIIMIISNMLISSLQLWQLLFLIFHFPLQALPSFLMFADILL